MTSTRESGSKELRQALKRELVRIQLSASALLTIKEEVSLLTDMDLSSSSPSAAC